MIKKILCSLIVFSISAALCTGCQKEGTTTQIIENKSTEKTIHRGDGHTNEELDLQLCCDNVEDMFRKGNYELDDITVDPPTEENDFFNIIIITKNKPEDNSEFVQMLEECLNALNNQVIKQDPEYDPSEEGYYGGLFDQYAVQLTATCVEDIMTLWPVNQKILPGSHDPIVTNNDILDFNDLEY
ncbi:MAG: hypothetical protein E7505_10895 [Ruminococcus sp.]|nr:hypothetical protein [Ruminococcus sp.]